jgi:membrane-bound metal-dependent hydrolase YbcI (DUF457 family)
MKKDRRFTLTVMVGAILPDLSKLVLRPMELFFGMRVGYKNAFLLSSLHGLIGVMLLSMVMAGFLAEDGGKARRIFAGLTLGYVSHFLLDSLSFYGVVILAPLSWKVFALALFWQDSLLPALVTVTVMLIVKLTETMAKVSSKP